MNTDTLTGGNPVKQNDKAYWDAHRRAQRAFNESTLISHKVMALFTYLLSRQGTKDYAFPSVALIAARFKIGKSTALRWIKETQSTLGSEIFKIEAGKPRKGSMGKTRNRYHCLDFGYWPLDVVERLEQSKPRKKPRKRSRYVESIGSIMTPTKSDPVVSKQDHSVETMESSNSKGDIEPQYYPYDSNPKNRICASCGRFAKDGLAYKDVWVCDVDCQQDYYERFIAFPSW